VESICLEAYASDFIFCCFAYYVILFYVYYFSVTVHIWDRMCLSVNTSVCMYICLCVCLVSCSSETSSYSSECRDDEEIALAIHAAEMTARHEARSKFKNAADLIHRLFVCISGLFHLITFFTL